MRILVAMLLGGILSSCSNVQNLKSDSTPKGPAAVDTLISAKTPPDSLPKKGTDTVVARKETARCVHSMKATAPPSDKTLVPNRPKQKIYDLPSQRICLQLPALWIRTATKIPIGE
jgi:hypothetical protein